MNGNPRYNGKQTFEQWQEQWKTEDRYNFKTIENKWQKIWEDEKAYKVTEDKTKEKFAPRILELTAELTDGKKSAL